VRLREVLSVAGKKAGSFCPNDFMNKVAEKKCVEMFLGIHKALEGGE